MTFEKIINRVATSLNSRNNTLTNGLQTCHYKDIPDILEHIHRHFSKSGIASDDTIALECPNSVLGALTLIYLLTRGCSFLLLPPADEKREAHSFDAMMPKLCKYRVAIENQQINAVDETIGSAFRVERNEIFQYTGASGKERLYLKTSGSMGISKMASTPHRNLLASAFNCIERYKFESSDRFAVPIPIFHGYGLSAALLPGVVSGASIDFQNDFNLLRYMDRERQFNPNIAFLTPALCKMMLSFRKNPRHYKLIVTSGEKIAEDIFRSFDSRFGCLVNQYGSTEMGPISACNPDDPAGLRATSIGKPMSGVQVRLNFISNEYYDSNIVTTGELCCRHPYGFEGYCDENGNMTASPEWFETGDIAEIRSDGYMEVFGRSGNSVNRSGFLVLFSDIERYMEKIENIERVVVVSANGEGERGEKIAAFCVPRLQTGTCHHISDIMIKDSCLSIMPKYAIPDAVFIIDRLPVLPSGKVDRQALANSVYRQ